MVDSPKLTDPESMTAELFEAITLVCTFSGTVFIPALAMTVDAYEEIRRIFAPTKIRVHWEARPGLIDRLHFELEEQRVEVIFEWKVVGDAR